MRQRSLSADALIRIASPEVAAERLGIAVADVLIRRENPRPAAH